MVVMVVMVMMMAFMTRMLVMVVVVVGHGAAVSVSTFTSHARRGEGWKG